MSKTKVINGRCWGSFIRSSLLAVRFDRLENKIKMRKGEKEGRKEEGRKGGREERRKEGKWKGHNETMCTAVLNKNVFFSQMESRRVKQILWAGGWYQWEGKDIRKGYRRVNVLEILNDLSKII
jgi:hypothetical protein